MKLMPNKIFVYAVIGGLFMIGCNGCASGLGYEKYVSKDPKLNISMDYISGWLYSEHRGAQDSYAQVLFYEPDRKDKSRKAGIAVTVRDMSKVEFDPLSVEAAADDLLKKRLKLKDAKILSKSKIELLRTVAVDIKLTYKTLDKLYSTDAKLIPVKERIITFNRGGKFYTVRYENTAEEFERFEKAFSHCIKTLELL